MTLTIRIAETPTDIAACMALRYAVFVDEQGVPEADELDGTDDGCTHILALDGARIVGAARYFLKDGIAKIGRVCVQRNMRGRGIGAALINHICDSSGAAKARLSAQVDAITFYARLGFAPIGSQFMDAGIPHQDMDRTL